MPRLLLLLSFLGLLLHSCSGAAYTFYVDATNGVDSPNCLNATAGVPCKTIGYALAPAGISDNIQIFILPGTYKGVGNVNLSPTAGGHLWTGYGSSRPVIDCEYQNNALTLTNTRTLNPFHTFENVEFRNCMSATGGAINILRAPSVTFTNCTFSNNHATQTGGAISASAGPARLTINSCIFRNNSAGTKGGAISAQSTSTTSTITLTLSNSTFDANQAEAGGAIYTNEIGNAAVTTVFADCVFTKNVASSSNGGAFLGESTALRTYSFAGSTVDNNCGNTVYTDSSDVQIRCASSEATCSIEDKGTITGCTDTYVPPTNSSDEDGGGSNKNRAIIIGVVVPISIIAIVAIALFLYFRKGHKKEMEKRDEYRKRILKALDNMPPEEQEAARIEAQNAGPKAPKCQLCKERPIVTPLPCGHEIVCAICRTILLECPVKNCKQPTR